MSSEKFEGGAVLSIAEGLTKGQRVVASFIDSCTCLGIRSGCSLAYCE
jgi:hypothetical protein